MEYGRRRRMKHSTRKRQILEVVIEMAENMDLREITRREIAARIKVQPTLITYYYGNMTTLLNTAIDTGCERGSERMKHLAISMNRTAGNETPEQKTA